MYSYEIPEELKHLEKVRDVFCFCCFTSLRYSDVANMKRSDVFDNYISITTIKTADSLKIELNDYSKSILSKYKDEQFKNNLALPVISNQKMNYALKELGQLCGIDNPIAITYYKGNRRIDEVCHKYELLSTHAGRRTFICNALMLGISPQIVMKWTGHSDYSAMKPYIAIADKAKEEAMSLFNKKSPNVKTGTKKCFV
jgi:integrase